MGRRKEIVLTEYQRQFAVEHYGLLLKFMGRHGLGDEEYPHRRSSSIQSSLIAVLRPLQPFWRVRVWQ